MGPICSTFVHSQIHLHYMCKIDSQSIQPFDHNFPVFWIVDPIKPPTMPPWGIVGLIVWAYVHSQMNPQTCTKFGANRSSRLTASQYFWMCDPPNPPPRHAPWGIEGWLVFSLDAHSQMNPQTWTKVGANRSRCLTASPDLNVWPPKTPQVHPCVSQGNLFGVYPFPDESAHVYQIWCQSDQPFDMFVWLLNVWPPNPPLPPMSRGELYLAYVHSQTNPQTCTKFGANRSSRLTASQDFWICDPLKPLEMPPCVLRFNWFGIYPFPDESAHVCQIWCQSVQPFGSFSWICAKLVRLLATGRAVSSKNMPKNNIYTSKIIIPARTCRHQRH